MSRLPPNCGDVSSTTSPLPPSVIPYPASVVGVPVRSENATLVR